MAAALVANEQSAPTAAAVAHRIEYLGLFQSTASSSRVAPPAAARQSFSAVAAAARTVFSRNGALVLRSGARINERSNGCPGLGPARLGRPDRAPNTLHISI
jgi:hypothetical protein